jgi:ribosomal protein S18 acetylase RimI-like enzyme
MAACEGVVHLRRAHATDARAIAEVHVRVWQHAYRGLVPAAMLDALNVDARERFWQREIGILAPDRRPWLADADGQIAGFVAAGPSHDDGAQSTMGEVYAIYVMPECWGRGVGNSLLAHAERDLRGHGYAEATLWVFAANHRTRRFYEAAGWQPDGTEKTETIGGADLSEVRYRKSIRQPGQHD